MPLATSPRPPQDQLPNLEEELESISIEQWKEKEEEATQAPTTDDELERFRREWREEVLAKRPGGGDARERGQSSHTVTSKNRSPERVKQAATFEPVLSISTSPIRGSLKSPPTPRRTLPVDLDEPPAGPSKIHVVQPPGKIGKIPFRSPRVQDKDWAVQLYARAVENEQSGKLNEALMMYRKAFKLDDVVDKTYARSQATLSSSVAAQNPLADPDPSLPSSSDLVSSTPPPDEPYSFQRHIQTQPDYERLHPPNLGVESQTPTSKSTIIRHSPLTTLLNSLPISTSETNFLPAEEDRSLPLASLPPELIDPILAHLDVSSIERFGSTCWRARWLTANSRVWKRVAEGIYRNPAILEGREVVELVGRHNGEWRTTFLEEERVRMDGCYISVCHYVRPGAGEEWVTITHLITYHRYLRFYPDGSVISFLTTDHPFEIVPLLKPNLRAKGLHIGRWRLLRSDTLAPDPLPTPHPSATSPNTKKPDHKAKILITELLEPGTDSPKYEFEMDLSLRETGRGKWNKLDLGSYHSINLGTGESLALSLKHQKPFYFSKVKSYNPPL